MYKFFVEVNLNCPHAEELKKEFCLQEGSELITKIGEDIEIFNVLVAKEQLETFTDTLGKSIIGEDIYSSGNVLLEKTSKEEWIFKEFDFKLTKDGVRLVCIVENISGELALKFKEELVLKKKNQKLYDDK